MIWDAALTSAVQSILGILVGVVVQLLVTVSHTVKQVAFINKAVPLSSTMAMVSVWEDFQK